MNAAAFLISVRTTEFSSKSLKICREYHITADGFFFLYPRTIRSCSCTTSLFMKFYQRTLLQVAPVFGGKAGAKVRTLLHILQIFGELFLKFFFWASLQPLLRGGKDTEKKTSLADLTCIRLSLNDCFPCRKKGWAEQRRKLVFLFWGDAFLLESGCKSTGFTPNHQTYQPLFLHFFQTE